MKLMSSALALSTALFVGSAFAWEATPGRPYDGQTIHALIVK